MTKAINKRELKLNWISAEHNQFIVMKRKKNGKRSPQRILWKNVEKQTDFTSYQRLEKTASDKHEYTADNIWLLETDDDDVIRDAMRLVIHYRVPVFP